MQSTDSIPCISSLHSRKSLRTTVRRQRQALTKFEQNSAASNLSRRLWRLQCVRQASTIAAYWPVDGEINPLMFLQQAHRRRKRTCLPVINSARSELKFYRWHPGRALRPNVFGIPEPFPGSPQIQLESVDVVLVPLVAFDARGHRLGMGGGFYDRTFAHCGPKRPLLIGIAHDMQQVIRLEVAPWDIDLDMVVSDRRIYPASRRRIY